VGFEVRVLSVRGWANPSVMNDSAELSPVLRMKWSVVAVVSFAGMAVFQALNWFWVSPVLQ